MRSVVGDFLENSNRFAPFIGQGELRLLANSHISVREELRQFFERPLVESFAEKLSSFEHERIRLMDRIISAINSAFTRHVPAFDPITEINCAIDAEFYVRGQDTPDEVLRLR